MNPFKSKKPEDVAKIVATFEDGLRAAEFELERAHAVERAASDQVIDEDSTDADKALKDAQKLVDAAEDKVRTERTKLNAAKRRYENEIAAQEAATKAARWKKTAELGEELISEGKQLDELQAQVAAKFKKVKELSELAVAECPHTDGSTLASGPMSLAELESTFKLLLYKYGMPTNVVWFDDPKLIPPFEKQLRQNMGWLLKLRPQ